MRDLLLPGCDDLLLRLPVQTTPKTLFESARVKWREKSYDLLCKTDSSLKKDLLLRNGILQYRIKIHVSDISSGVGVH